jgi:hypothetical protein
MVISRILFPEFLQAAIIYLIPISQNVRALKIGGHRPPLQHPRCDDTRGIIDRLSFLCFVLHRMGFFLPRESLRAR